MPACQNEPACEIIVFYSKEQKGTCILCSDMENSEPTPHEVTRYYQKTEPSFPPAPPHKAGVGGFSVIDNPEPPPPPYLTGVELPPPPPGSLDRLGWRAKQHFDCSFFAAVEFSVNQAEGYTDSKAATRFDCCNACGLHGGCQDFVYQHSTGMCILLPHVPADQLVQTPNEHVISGHRALTACYTPRVL